MLVILNPQIKEVFFPEDCLDNCQVNTGFIESNGIL
jgi:hypothetical protein